MNSVLAFMNSFVVVVMVMNVFAPRETGAALCSQQAKPACVATDNTLATCNTTTGVCTCKAGFLPIPTGCASKLAQPTVALAEGRMNQRVPDAPVTLSCTTREVGTLAFEWKKNGTIIANEIKQQLTVQGDDAKVLGKYSCMVKETSLGLTSDYSPESEILTLNVAAVTPVLTVSTQTAAAGVTLDVVCAGIPYGAKYKFRLDPSGDLVEKVVQDSTKTKIACVLDDTNLSWKSRESVAVDMPAAATDITMATISPSTALTIKAGGSLTFTCATTPVAKFMDTPTAKVTYSFQDTGNTSMSPTGNTYTLTSSATDTTARNVTCSATYGTNKAKTSATVIVNFSDNYIKVPTINATSTTVTLGSPVSLKCIADPNIPISWLKDGTTITRETDHIIQFGRFNSTNQGKYVCTATKDFYIANSEEVFIKSNAPHLRLLGSAVTVIAAVTSWRLL